MEDEKIEGDYYLTGVMETGCGIKLNFDYSFDFFYSYGALDRHGYGTWKKLSDTEIILHTNYEGLKPFTILLEETKETNETHIEIPNFNKILLDNTRIEIISGGEIIEKIADSNGHFIFEQGKADAIIVTCMFYFDNSATLTPQNEHSNYFELAPNHNLPLVHFKDARFQIEDRGLLGKLHLLDDSKMFHFERA